MENKSTFENLTSLDRRSFLAGLLALPAVKYLPAKKEIHDWWNDPLIPDPNIIDWEQHHRHTEKMFMFVERYKTPYGILTVIPNRFSPLQTTLEKMENENDPHRT